MKSLYATPAAFDRALKRAVKDTGKDPGAGYRQALRDRFLCRVFANGAGSFVLKGGGGMLARIPDARATRDLDFATRSSLSADEARAEIERAASLDLGDWCRFALTKCEESLDDNGYSRMLRMRFSTYVGEEEKDPVLIDLSLSCEMTLPPERIAPANRVYVDGVETCDYLVCALPDQLADKLCAIMERQPAGWPSSRMKDLADVISYATRESFHADKLAYAISCECRHRSMDVPSRFAAPEEWRPNFSSFARKAGVAAEFQRFDAACAFAASFFDPVLAHGESHGNAIWDPAMRAWVGSQEKERTIVAEEIDRMSDEGADMTPFAKTDTARFPGRDDAV